MNPGDLRHRITFQELTTTTNENGFEVKTWIDFKTVWAKVSNLHGRDTIRLLKCKLKIQ